MNANILLSIARRDGQKFFEPLVRTVLSNCTIAGLSYPEYKKQMPSGGQSRPSGPSSLPHSAPCAQLTSFALLSFGCSDTEPFRDDLHYQIVTYQNDLFDAREQNANARRTEPDRILGVRASNPTSPLLAAVACILYSTLTPCTCLRAL